MPRLIESLAAGLEFIEFLGDRINSNNSKNALRSIYNTEFKDREGAKHPNFSTVVYALLKFNKVYIRHGKVFTKVRRQVQIYSDQWRRRQVPQPQSLSCGTADPHAPPTAIQALEMTPKKKLATDVLNKMKNNRKEMASDKRGIEITSDPAAVGGKIQIKRSPREPCTISFHILNNGSDNINFNSYGALSRVLCFTLVDERRVTKANPVFLCPKESYDVTVRMKLDHPGYFPVKLYFEFQVEPDLPKSVRFQIIREIEATVQTELTKELGPVAPYVRVKVPAYKAANEIVEGVPPESSAGQHMPIAVKLKEYNYPRYLKELVKQEMEDSECLSSVARQKLPSVKSILNSPLNMKDYSHRFHLLLYLEEIQMEVGIRQYDLHKETMTRDQANRKLLVLKVPGLAEQRPSVLRGDCLRVTRSEEQGSAVTVYTGYVHKVELDRVKLGFSWKFLESFLNNMRFNVEFTINRLTLKLQHRAVDLAVEHQLGEVLFPSGAAVPDVPVPELRMFNSKLQENKEQCNAVQHIVAGSSKPAPYIVFGPPGTGKTITLVEAIEQVTKADQSARILACAPSNSACDILCDRLVPRMDTNQVYRMYAISRDPSSIPDKLLKYSNWDDRQGCFVFPEKEILMKYKVIVTTLFTAGRLVTVGIPVGHFSHVFVDEAGQAEEPQCVIAVAGLLSVKSQLVLAGDPEQLGPILYSPYAIKYGLELSLLERLMKSELYQGFDKRFVTKLLRNYRSHDAILKIPNELFYNGELKVFADKAEREIYCNWDGLPRKGFPVVFYGVMGKEQREANSPSFFNLFEIEILLNYLTLLLETQGKKGLPKLFPQDIGIITPYRKQVEKIQKALKSASTLKEWINLKELKVGSVEEFQGQEKRIIMVSTVRSTIDYVKLDKEHKMGFLANKKRFNVALTRAKSLLIVVGNPVILKTEPNWERFISYCEEMKGYAGVDFKYEKEDEFVAKMASLKIMDSEGEENDLQ